MNDTLPKASPHVTWRYKVDKEHYETIESTLTGREILERAGRTPTEKFLLVLAGHGHPREIRQYETVDFTVPGVERFRTMLRECTEGFSGRRDYRLPGDDEQFLDSTGLSWETVTTNGVMRLIVYSYPVPDGFNHGQVDLYLRIDATYPDTQIDMVYVWPPLKLNTGGRAIGAVANDAFGGKTWQRWSRHRTSGSAWRPGVDCVETHLALVNDWFAKEVLGGS